MEIGRLALNEPIASIAPSVSLSITSRAKAMAAAGRQVIRLAAGEPDFDTPAHIKQAAIRALEAGETKYTPEAGLLQLRKAIVRKFQQENGVTYGPEQIVVSNGAKHSLFNVVMALCRPGDEFIIPSPYWLSYPEMVKVAGGVSIFVHCREDHGFKMSPEQFQAALTPRTKAVILNSPCNPTGTVYSEAELRTLADMAVARDVFVISDEIYEKIVYDGVRHASPAGFSSAVFDRTVTVNGFSKAYAMTGWRLGYAAAPLPLARAMSAFQSHSTSGPNTFAQFGAIAAIDGGVECQSEMVKAFAERRAYLYGRLTAIAGLSCVKPMGAFYMLPNVSRFGLDSVTLANRLLDETGVAVVPGAAFGSDRHIRLSYACSLDDLKEGLDRLERFLKAL